MSRILVEVLVPAAGMRRDVSIPFEKRMGEIAELMKLVFRDDVRQVFQPDESTMLCDGVSGEPFDPNLTPEDLGLQNGSIVMIA